MIKVLQLAAEMIQTAGLGEQGVDLFVHTLPADVKHGIMLKFPFAPTEIDEGLKDFYEFEFQVIVRDVDPEAGYARCRDIAKALTVNRYHTPELSISWMKPTSLPISYPRGDMDDIETSCRVCVGYGEIVA